MGKIDTDWLVKISERCMLAVFKNLGKVNCLGINVRWGTVCTPTAMVVSGKPSSLR